MIDRAPADRPPPIPRWLAPMLTVAALAAGCVPQMPDFGECNRDADCVVGQCVDTRCLVPVDPDAGADGAIDTPSLEFGPLLTCDAPVIPDRETRSPCGRACAIDGFVPIEPGRFTMGASAEEDARFPMRPLDETAHEVTVTRGFWMKAHEVTVGEWQALGSLLPTGEQAHSPVGCDGPDCPIVGINAYEAMAWCNARSQLEGLPPCYRMEGCAMDPMWDTELVCERVVVETADRNPLDCVGYRLPTEAEWEYAIRAGTETMFYSGPGDGTDGEHATLDPIAWHSGNSGGVMHPVGLKAPNAWGLHDMSGNAWERVWDGAGAYRAEPVTDPLGAGGDVGSIMRGGSFVWGPIYLRSAARSSRGRASGADDMGFRPVRTRIVCGDAVCSALETPASCPGDCPLEGYAIVPAGYDVLGSPEGEAGRGEGPPDPEPQRPVRLARSVWLKQTEVTQAEWAALALAIQGAEAPSAAADCPHCPVENISWYAALAWCNAASRAEGLPECYDLEACTGAPGGDLDCVDVRVNTDDGDPQRCVGYRLPTESEWEYAARATADTAWHHATIADAEVDDALDTIGWYAANAGGEPHPVGQKSGSCWGLYDVAGNVAEWVWDAPGQHGARVTDPQLPPDPNVRERTVRGGAFDSPAGRTRAAARDDRLATARDPAVGFRPARTIHRPVTMPEWPLTAEGPAGGLIFYDKGVYTNGWRYLEAAPQDLFGAWGCGQTAQARGDLLPDLVPPWIGSGRLNTPLIMQGCDQPGIAAAQADALMGGGFDDWFLPSPPTFEHIHAALMQHGLGDFSTRDDAFYWTSHQIDRDFANAWQVVERRIVAWNKSITSRLRPVRAF